MFELIEIVVGLESIISVEDVGLFFLDRLGGSSSPSSLRLICGDRRRHDPLFPTPDPKGRLR